MYCHYSISMMLWEKAPMNKFCAPRLMTLLMVLLDQPLSSAVT